MYTLNMWVFKWVDPFHIASYVYLNVSTLYHSVNLILNIDPLPLFMMQMTAAYSSTMTDLKLNKKKQTADPSFGKCIKVKYKMRV